MGFLLRSYPNPQELESAAAPGWFNLLLMVSLAYAFLLTRFDPELKSLCEQLVRRFCPRPGKRSREVSTPLYRFRAAICFLCFRFPNALLPQPQSSG